VDTLITWLGGQAYLDRTISVALLVTARIMPLMLLTPWLALRTAPKLLVVAVSLIFGAILTPCALQTAPELSTNILALSVSAARELLIGMIFAVAATLPFYALEWAGWLADTWRDAVPPTGSQSPLSDLYVMMGMVLFLSLGGYRLAINAFTDSFVAVPVGGTIRSLTMSSVAWGSVRLVASALSLAFVLATPIAVMVALSQLVVGLFSRTVPNVSFDVIIGMPLRRIVGLIGALLCISLIIAMLPQISRDAIEAASALVARLFKP
jgi:type III secretory pathway component EscT